MGQRTRSSLAIANYVDARWSRSCTLSPYPIHTPNSYKEAMKTPQADEWRKACTEEVQSLQENAVWKLVDVPPPDARVLKGRWVFKIKHDVNGKPCRYKARWVIRGDKQREGLDYDETYASVAKPQTLKVLMALVAAYDLECKQIDIITAFLNAIMDDVIIYC
jgi:Reverse transcriptase (RNA-dependent DNA polymerase)